MEVAVKLFATLRDGRFSVDTNVVAPGSTARDIIRSLGIRDDEAALVLINGRHAELDNVLSDGDTLALFPPIGGG